MSRPELTGEWTSRMLERRPADGWSLTADGYDPVVEREVESRLAVSNGFLGVRASLEIPTMASRPRTFVAGLFDDVEGVPGSPFLAPAPDWLRLALTVNGHEVEMTRERTEVSRTLDLGAGVLHTSWTHRLPSGGTVTLEALRLVSRANRSLGLQVVRIVADGEAEFEAMLVPTTLALVLEGIEGNLSYWRTAESRRGLVIAMQPSLSVNGIKIAPEEDGHRLACRWRWAAEPGDVATFTRTAAFARYQGRDEREAQSDAVAVTIATRHDAVVEAHVAAWDERWRAAGVTIDGEPEAQLALRYAIYQLISAGDPADERVSIGARALTGEAYSGHVFWDTEIFLLPFYTLTWPEAARAMLMYRYHTLPEARAKARRLGYAGALYAWESADTGEEATPESARLPDGQTVRILAGVMEHHISADVAFAVYRYWEATGDNAFLLDAGAEILFETARFWCARTTLEGDGLHHIRQIIGPDEYHEAVDDNAYTNVMAQWNLETAANVARIMASRWPERWDTLSAALALTQEEVARWDDAARHMYTGFDAGSQLFEQFAGFFQLDTVDLASYEPREAPMDVILGRERTQRSQVIKQADVVMLLGLLGDRFPAGVREANFRYYEPRTGHGISLSPAIHALVAARLGDLALAERYRRETAAIDLGDAMGTTAGGIHIGALGGLWQATIFGFAGVSYTGDALRLDPRLPEHWRRMSFRLRYHGCDVDVEIDPARSTVTARMVRGEGTITVEVCGVSATLREGGERTWPLPTHGRESEASS